MKSWFAVASTDIGSVNLNGEELDPLKDDLEMLLASVTERVATLTQENDALSEWLEAKKCEKSIVSKVPCAR